MSREASQRANILFVCSRNRWRSPTAEKVYERHPQLNVRSRGTSSNAQRTVRQADISWAHIIMVMEQKHKQRLLADYPQLAKFENLHVLDIPDDYQYLDPDLIELLEATIDPLLERL